MNAQYVYVAARNVKTGDMIYVDEEGSPPDRGDMTGIVVGIRNREPGLIYPLVLFILMPYGTVQVSYRNDELVAVQTSS